MNLQTPNSEIYTIAFYNTENLFDYVDDSLIMDSGYLASSSKNWNKERYLNKVYKIGMALSKIGHDAVQRPPSLIGLAEVENDRVLEALVKSTYLKDYNYGYIRYDSPDERGIDVALLYDKDNFTLETSKNIVLNVKSELGDRDNTRDILQVSGYLNSEKIHLLINHWPSRHEKSDTTGHKRMYAAQMTVALIDGIQKDEADAKVIIMGDFNDNPKNDSIQYLKNSKSLFNPMEKLMSYTRGSANHNSKWILFDQILMTRNFLEPDKGGLTFLKADIFDEKFLTHFDGKYKGQPFRTYVGNKYKGGFSDHFPVYIQLKK